jgi:hypothetical protein
MLSLSKGRRIIGIFIIAVYRGCESFHKCSSEPYRMMTIDDSFTPVTKDEAFDMFQVIHEAASAATELDEIQSHTLAVYFMVISHAMLHDQDPKVPNSKALSEQYQTLSRAAFSYQSITKSTTLHSLQALFLMCRYNCEVYRTRSEDQWLLMGLCARLSKVASNASCCSVFSRLILVLDWPT